MERDQIISDAYYASRGAIIGTLRLAKLRDPKIKKADIERWRRANNNDEKRPTKYNTWVGKEPKEEYQADLFFPHNGPPMLMMVDTFSKSMAVEPVDEKKAKMSNKDSSTRLKKWAASRSPSTRTRKAQSLQTKSRIG